MSDCKHEKRTDSALKNPRYVSYCLNCDAGFTQLGLETLERAEKAEALVNEKILDALVISGNVFDKDMWPNYVKGSFLVDDK
jgi:hypothetical protein